MKMFIVKGTTSKSVGLFIRDSSVTTGAGLTGLAYNTASLVAYYWRPNTGTATAITLATLANAQAAYSSGGFVAVDGTNMPGVYRLDIPDACLASGADQVIIMLRGAANMEPVVFEIELTNFNPMDAVRGGLTALPNANAEAAGGLFTRGTGAGQINQTVNGLINSNLINISGAAVSTTTAQLGVNVVQVNAVATSSVTAVNANLGTTQPINHTGTGGTATVKADTTQIAGATVNTTTAQIGANIVQVIGDPVQASSSKTTNWGGTP